MSIVYRPSRASDGKEMWRLLEEIGTLERNTGYFYVLFACEFHRSCVVAEKDGRMIGFVVGFRPPERPGSVFVWQVGVSPKARGQGVASKLLKALLEQTRATVLEATVSPDNLASRALFQSLAQKMEVTCTVEPYFREHHFYHPHEPEELFSIGPLQPSALPTSPTLA
ncbi:MAG: diaminobutyrate acetyltransferase [Vulcanimicrobiota bacterium]